jgi:hypothetical protein
MSTSPAREFHGRDAELALIRGELERVSAGAEALVIVEGAAGMGKSRLLAEVSTIAHSLGIRVGKSAADPSETVVELATLLAALFDGAEPLLDPREFTTLHAPPEQRFWLLRFARCRCGSWDCRSRGSSPFAPRATRRRSSTHSTS